MNIEKMINFYNTVESVFPDTREFSISEIKTFPSHGISVPGSFWQCRVSEERGSKFSIDVFREKFIENYEPTQRVNKPVINRTNNNTVKQIEKEEIDISLYIPQVSETFVPGNKNYKMIQNIIKSKEFFPCYIYGISGIGKTTSIEQACAKESRPFFRVQITRETIDEDLIGTMKLVNGDTVWQDGPIIKAYKTGAVVVLDEIDLNSNLMILQGILEKKPFYIKQTGELVHPVDGFQVFATGNTKGDGSDIRFVGTTCLNEAFLDRFAIMLKQELPSISLERKIAMKFIENNSIDINEHTFNDFMNWVESTRSMFEQSNGESSYISTRRIGFILKAYKITGNMTTALDMGLKRFNEEDTTAFIMMWKAINGSSENNTQDSNNENQNDNGEI